MQKTRHYKNIMMALATAQKNREMFAIKKSYSIEVGYHLLSALMEVGSELT